LCQGIFFGSSTKPPAYDIATDKFKEQAGNFEHLLRSSSHAAHWTEDPPWINNQEVKKSAVVYIVYFSMSI